MEEDGPDILMCASCLPYKPKKEIQKKPGHNNTEKIKISIRSV